MRLMLGKDNEPDLLVTVENDYDPKRFKFHVINGEWYGEFIDGNISVFGPPSGDFTNLGNTEIICDNQDRLRSDPWHDYETVFDNFDNPDYVGPVAKRVVFDDLDDDVPF